MLAKLKSEYEREPDSIETNRAIAEYYMGHDMIEEAEPYLVKMLEIDEDIASANNQFGVICFKREQYGQAEYHFRKALQANFKMMEAHFNLAFLYNVSGKFADALSHYKEALGSDQDDPEIYRLMGQCAQEMGILEDSEAFFAESFRLAPMAETALDLSILYISREKYAEAEDLLTLLLDLVEDGKEDQPSSTSRLMDPSKRADNSASTGRSPDDQSATISLDRENLNFALGLVLAKQGKFMNAIKHLRNVVAVDEHNEQAYNYLGECCAAIGLYKEAGSFLSKASKLDPHYLEPIANLGKLHYDQKNYQKAIAAIEQYKLIRDEMADIQGENIAKSPVPEDELMYELLGIAYRETGNKSKAMEVWAKSLELNSDQPGIRLLMDDSPSPIYMKRTLSIED